MGYKHTNSRGATYFLNTKQITLNGGATGSIYYFSKDERKDTACDLPADRVVSESPRTGLPLLKKKGN